MPDESNIRATFTSDDETARTHAYQIQERKQRGGRVSKPDAEMNEIDPALSGADSGMNGADTGRQQQTDADAAHQATLLAIAKAATERMKDFKDVAGLTEALRGVGADASVGRLDLDGLDDMDEDDEHQAGGPRATPADLNARPGKRPRTRPSPGSSQTQARKRSRITPSQTQQPQEQPADIQVRPEDYDGEDDINVIQNAFNNNNFSQITPYQPEAPPPLYDHQLQQIALHQQQSGANAQANSTGVPRLAAANTQIKKKPVRPVGTPATTNAASVPVSSTASASPFIYNIPVPSVSTPTTPASQQAPSVSPAPAPASDKPATALSSTPAPRPATGGLGRTVGRSTSTPSSTVKRYPCPHEGCNFASARAHNLQTHIQTHLGIKAWVCPHASNPNGSVGKDGKLIKCDKSFSRKHDLRRHLTTVHGGDGAEQTLVPTVSVTTSTTDPGSLAIIPNAVAIQAHQHQAAGTSQQPQSQPQTPGQQNDISVTPTASAEPASEPSTSASQLDVSAAATAAIVAANGLNVQSGGVDNNVAGATGAARSNPAGSPGRLWNGYRCAFDGCGKVFGRKDTWEKHESKCAYSPLLSANTASLVNGLVSGLQAISQGRVTENGAVEERNSKEGAQDPSVGLSEEPHQVGDGKEGSVGEPKGNKEDEERPDILVPDEDIPIDPSVAAEDLDDGARSSMEADGRTKPSDFTSQQQQDREKGHVAGITA